MYYIYILHNDESDSYYIGSTNNLERRLKEHLRGKTRTTKVLKTDKIAYREEFNTEKEARDREKKLKSYKSKKYIKWLISRHKPQ
ncbi:MAG TPA: GIY-YIG nuclease family protein [Patescibacteria group bacterium]|nr:GIY-YIG nuclease family protein [Patescibacteria group bacterium]